MIRRVATGLVGLWFLLSAAVSGAAAPNLNTQDPASFIQSLGEEAIQMLSDKSLSEKDRLVQFRTLLHAGFDMKTIGRFTLGRYSARASDAEFDEFQRLFDEYVVQTYASRLGQYSGEKLQIGAARKDESGDILVGSEIVPREGPQVRVEWRVRGEPGKFKIIDVIVEGISMAITQRAEFSAVIQRSGGKIDGLISELRRKVPPSF
jgi:phospholipid transport system substrate-binding protein